MSRAGRRSEPDRFESERSEFFHRARETYLQLAIAHPERFVVVDATQSLEDVEADVGNIARELLALPASNE